MLNLLQKCERSFPHKKEEIKHNGENVFVWKTERRFEDRASVAEKKERQNIQFFFFVFFRSEEQYCFRCVVR